MKISTRKLTTEIIHPTDGEFIVTVQKLRRAAAIDFQSRIRRFERHIAVLHPVTGAPVLDDKGSPIIKTVAEFNMAVIRETLSTLVIGWRGLRDENGNEIAFDILKTDLLLDEGLDFETEKDIEVEDAEGGKRLERQKVTQPFWEFLFEKAVDLGSFVSDPKGKT